MSAVVSVVAMISVNAGRLSGRFEVTPVQGPSWLHHLGLSLDETCMGHAGAWVASPVAHQTPEWDAPADGQVPRDSVVISGADLYRYSCQPCHKADGAGLPPKIHSVIGPVRAMSPAAVRAQMKERGYAMDDATIRDLTSQSEAALRARLRNGGDKMPSFPHLQDVEQDALIGYLKQLAGVEGAEARTLRIGVPQLRVGELIVKGTCHICHDAAGPGRVDVVEVSMMRGVIPALASLPLQRTKDELIRKVRVGLSQPSPHMVHGRMPVFEYFTAEEIAAVYDYLRAYPAWR